jgi:ferredoxin
MATLTFHPAAAGPLRAVPLSPVTTLLVALMKAGAPIRHDCGGRALCGTCRVSIEDGKGLSPMRALERARLEALGIGTDGRVRLACQTVARVDIEARGLVEPAGGEDA